jgi:O-antigen/teichoic acid export membrane protein
MENERKDDVVAPSSDLKSKTAKGLIWGGMGNGVQQILNMLIGIILARHLGADDYGMVGVLGIFTAVAGTIQESGFTNALVNKRDATHADYNAVFWFSTLMGLGMYLILFFSAPLIANFFHKPSELVPLSRFLFLNFLFSSTATAHNAILTKKMMVKQKAIASMIAIVVSGSIGVTLVYLGVTYWALAIQTVVYTFCIAFFYWFFSSWRPTWTINLRPLRQMFVFSSKILITNILNQINNNVFSVLLGRKYTMFIAGYYTQASKWNNMGTSLITGMVSSVAQPVLVQVAETKDRQQMVFRKMLRFMAFISFPAMLGLALVSKEFIIITVKARWLPCVPIMQWLCVFGAFMPITSLSANLLISRGKSKTYMWSTIALGLLQLLVLLICVPYGLMTMVKLFVIVNIGWMFVWYVLVRHSIHLRFVDALRDVVPFAGAAALTMIVTYYVTMSLQNIYLLLAAKILVAAVIYSAIMWLSNAKVFRESIAYFKHRKS